ncbi:hypothetical protein TURU_015412 [Turdus rufiventris]|nr:hypothetical protein TURU_015412 [Turdus rufiventris]
MICELENQGVVSKTHSPFNSPIWPVRKSDGEWRLTVDYCALNKVTPQLSAAVPDMLELQYELESKAARHGAGVRTFLNLLGPDLEHRRTPEPCDSTSAAAIPSARDRYHQHERLSEFVTLSHRQFESAVLSDHLVGSCRSPAIGEGEIGGNCAGTGLHCSAAAKAQAYHVFKMLFQGQDGVPGSGMSAVVASTMASM